MPKAMLQRTHDLIIESGRYSAAVTNTFNKTLAIAGMGAMLGFAISEGYDIKEVVRDLERVCEKDVFEAIALSVESAEKEVGSL